MFTINPFTGQLDNSGKSTATLDLRYLKLTGGTMTGGITNLTSINPLTTVAESWIGPSTTTGIYFKGGNVGIGNDAPTRKLQVTGDYGQFDTGILTNEIQASGSGSTINLLGGNAIANTIGSVDVHPMSSFQHTSGVPAIFKVRGTIAQSSTAGYTGILLDVTESTTGSGNKRLLDLQVGSVSKFSIDNTGILENILSANNKIKFTEASIAFSQTFSDFATAGPVIALSRPSNGEYLHSIAAYNTAGDAKNNLGISARSDIVFQVSGGSEAMRLTNNGKVGIAGTTNPTALLHLAAGTATANTAPLKFTSGTLLTTPEAGAMEYLDNQFYIRGSDGLSVAGNVGIGTTSPGAILAISAALSRPTITSTTTTNDVQLSFTNGGGSLYVGRDNATASSGSTFLTSGGLNYAGVISVSGLYPLQLATNSISRVTIDSTGNVGIGTTGPQAKLDVGVTATKFANHDLHVGKDGQTVVSISGAYSVAGDGPAFILQRFRGTHAALEATNANDALGLIYFNGYTDDTKNSASIEGYADTGYGATGSDSPGRLVFKTTPDGAGALEEKMRITSAGNVGIGTTEPTAVLHLKAGTATASTAPLKFNSGTLNTTAEAGAVEFLAERFSLTPTSLARQVIPGVLFTQTADATVANTVTETTLIGTGVGTVTLPANFFVAGKTIKMIITGYFSTTGTPNDTMAFKLGSTTVLTTGAMAMGSNSSNQLWRMEMILTCRATGTTGTVMAQGYCICLDSTVAVRIMEMVTTATTTINTTISLAIDSTNTWGTASESNTITATNCILEVLN